MADNYLLVKGENGYMVKVKLVDLGDGTYAHGNALLGSTTGRSISASQTRPDNVLAYAAGDVVGTNPAANITFANVLPTAGSAFVVLGVWLRIDRNAIPVGMSSFLLHLYDAAPAAIADNAAYNLPVADRGKYLGNIPISGPRLIGDTVWLQVNDVNFSRRLAAGSTSLFGILQTLTIFTPTALTVKTAGLSLAPV